MNVTQMREAISGVYSGSSWKNKVYHMEDDQVMAIYFSFLKNGKFNKPPIEQLEDNQMNMFDILKEKEMHPMKHKTIAIDFDGTLCENKYPEIGEPNIELINYIKWRQLNGSKIILWTCRMGDRLNEAISWCKEQGIEFDAVNENLKEHIETYGSDSRKIFATEYIDDKCNPIFKLPFKSKNLKENKKE